VRGLSRRIPGAIKIGGLWTFDETRLRNWLAAMREQKKEPALTDNDLFSRLLEKVKAE
jgi:hypothetical protein